MKFTKRLLLVFIFVLLFGQAFCQMFILSGPEKGSYNRFTNDIVSVLGEKNGLSLKNRTTAGSAQNFREITEPMTADKIALIQSDYLDLMKAADKLNNTNKTGSLKVLLQLATEEIHIVAKKNSGLKGLRDLDNKKVAIGDEDQGSFATGKIIREKSKVNWTSYYVGFDQLLKQLSGNNMDAILVVGSAPVEMLDIDPKIMINEYTLLELDDLNGWAKNYEIDTIYKRDYKWLDKNTPTFAVRTLLVVNESRLTDEDKRTLAAVKAGIIENLDLLKKQGHPKWKSVIIPDESGSVAEKSTTLSGPPDPVSSDKKDVITYRVQIYSRNYKQKEDQITINGKTYKEYVYSHLGAYRYTIGEFTSLSSAAELQKACRESGYDEAFVAAFKNNVRSTDPGLFK